MSFSVPTISSEFLYVIGECMFIIYICDCTECWENNARNFSVAFAVNLSSNMSAADYTNIVFSVTNSVCPAQY